VRSGYVHFVRPECPILFPTCLTVVVLLIKFRSLQVAYYN
jgi:hypothetical protein